MKETTKISLRNHALSDQNKNETTGNKSAFSAGLDGRLIKAAASLLTKRMSDLDEDYPKRFSKYVLREIEKHNEHLTAISRELRAIADAL